jgi:hypothetical protein
MHVEEEEEANLIQVSNHNINNDNKITATQSRENAYLNK